MASQMAILSRARKTLLKTLNHHNNPFKASISTFTFLSQEPQLAKPSLLPPSPTPLPPNPASGSPLYNENQRSTIPQAQSIIPLGFLHQSSSSEFSYVSSQKDRGRREVVSAVRILFFCLYSQCCFYCFSRNVLVLMLIFVYF